MVLTQTSYSRKRCKFWVVWFLHIFTFFPCNFLFFQAGINEFEISIKFCVFNTILDFCATKIWLIIAYFAHLECKCEKTILNIFKHFLPMYNHSSFDYYWHSKNCVTFKPFIVCRDTIWTFWCLWMMNTTSTSFSLQKLTRYVKNDLKQAGFRVKLCED